MESLEPTSLYGDYEKVIYSGGAVNKLKVKFNNVEYQNIDDICEKLTVKSRMLPDDGSNVFMLSNFVAKEATLVIHKDSVRGIEGPVEISIGTLVNGSYEYVKIGVFNISDMKIDDKGKFEIKLRDNSVKFDFNYNAKDLMDLHDGSVTLLQILEDILEKAGVGSNISSFNNDDMVVSVYDNTIKARQYIAYIAEQAGAIPVIDRDGLLDFVYLDDLDYKYIPLNVVEKYKINGAYRISKVVYQDAIRDFQTGSDDYNNLYIDSANPYINSTQQIIDIYNIVNDFVFYGCTTEKVLGNPKINPYDIIYITDENDTPMMITLGNNTLEYTGVMTMKLDTNINTEKMKENITTRGEATFKKWVKTELDNEKVEISLQAGQIETLNSDINDVNSELGIQSQKINTVEQKITATEEEIRVISTNIDNINGDVKEITTTTGFTFNSEGLNIAKDGEPTKSKLDEAGLEITDNNSSNEQLLFYSGYVNQDVVNKESSLEDYKDKSVVYTKDLVVKEYVAMPNGRFENVHNDTYGDGIGIFI